MPEFDAYFMVDCSASSRPKVGPDSIWYCLLTRDGDRLGISALENPPTRQQATAELRACLLDLVQRGQSVLVGFDFPYGYPSGLASALRLSDIPPWLAVWRELAGRMVDRADNSNNGFNVAAEFNHRISQTGYPFWGCPSSCESTTLTSTKGLQGRLAEKRLTDVGNMQPIWKLYGNGSVGSQALVGIPHVTALRNDPALGPVSRVWPFETGVRGLPDRRDREWLVLHAEIYPSMLPIQPAEGEVKDCAQVRMLAAHFAVLDDSDRLGDLFAAPAHLTPAERKRIEDEEGWTLGVGNSQAIQRPVSDLGRPASLLPAKRVALGLPHRAGAGRTTEVGFENRNGRVTVRSTGLAGTDHGQYVYLLRCRSCGHEYGANGSDIHIRRCPACQGGRPDWRIRER